MILLDHRYWGNGAMVIKLVTKLAIVVIRYCTNKAYACSKEARYNAVTHLYKIHLKSIRPLCTPNKAATERCIVI